MPNSISLVILAAGLSSRFGDDKQIFPLSKLNRPLLYFTLQDAIKTGIRHAVVITRHEIINALQNNIFKNFPSMDFDIVFQNQTPPELPKSRLKPWGTGHAVLCAKNYINKNFIIINADDFYGTNAISSAVNFLNNSKENQFCCMEYKLSHALSPNGFVSRGIIEKNSENFITNISEFIKIKQQDNFIHAIEYNSNLFKILSPNQPVSLSLFGLNYTIFDVLEEKMKNFTSQHHNSQSKEFHLPSSLTDQNLINKNFTIKSISTQDHWLGLTHKQDLSFVEEKLNQYISRGIYT